MDEDLLRRCAGNCGGAYMAWAEAAGRPSLAADDLLLADLGLPVPLPANSGTLLRRLPPEETPALLERLRAFFSGPGGGYQLWSIWPTPDLSPHGFGVFAAPAMIRDSGGERRPPPGGLEVERAATARDFAEAGRIVAEVFGGGVDGSTVFPQGLVDSRSLAVWVGRVGGTPVTTAAAYAGDGFVGVYAVATTASARGRGYGEAVSWEAVMWRPDLPATLQASPMGRPVYERMGFRAVADFTVWERPTRGSRPTAAPSGGRPEAGAPSL